MTEIYLTICLCTHNGDGTPQTSKSARKHHQEIRRIRSWSSFTHLGAVLRILEQYHVTGNVTCKYRGRSKPYDRTPDTFETIRAKVVSSPTWKSVRQVAAENEVTVFDSMAHTSNQSTHSSVQDPCLLVSDNRVPRKVDMVCGGIR